MVRPIDLADMLSKTELVAKLKEQLKSAGELEQRQVASKIKQKITADAERTKGAEKSDLLIISNDQAKEEEKRKSKQKDNEPEDESLNGENDSDDESSTRLDIKA